MTGYLTDAYAITEKNRDLARYQEAFNALVQPGIEIERTGLNMHPYSGVQAHLKVTFLDASSKDIVLGPEEILSILKASQFPAGVSPARTALSQAYDKVINYKPAAKNPPVQSQEVNSGFAKVIAILRDHLRF